MAVLGLISFYGVLATGPMSLLSPLIALVQSAVPVAVAAFTGQGLNLTAWIAIVIAVVAILLLSPPPKPGRDRISARGAGLALFSGLTLGASLVALDFAPNNSGIVPAFWEIAVGLVLLLILLLAVRTFRGRAPWLSVLEPDPATARTISSRRAWIEAAAAGLLAGVADIFVVTGLHVGNLAVIAVLIALYPVLTVILAATVLKERMTPLQFVGIGLAVGASLLFTAS
jgi:drug/metabolite transporter (DMT)-like permease